MREQVRIASREDLLSAVILRDRRVARVDGDERQWAHANHIVVQAARRWEEPSGELMRALRRAACGGGHGGGRQWAWRWAADKGGDSLKFLDKGHRGRAPLVQTWRKEDRLALVEREADVPLLHHDERQVAVLDDARAVGHLLAHTVEGVDDAVDAGTVEVEGAAAVFNETELRRVHLERLEDAVHRKAEDVEHAVDAARGVLGHGIDLRGGLEAVRGVEQAVLGEYLVGRRVLPVEASLARRVAGALGDDALRGCAVGRARDERERVARVCGASRLSAHRATCCSETEVRAVRPVRPSAWDCSFVGECAQSQRLFKSCSTVVLHDLTAAIFGSEQERRQLVTELTCHRA